MLDKGVVHQSSTSVAESLKTGHIMEHCFLSVKGEKSLLFKHFPSTHEHMTSEGI